MRVIGSVKKELEVTRNIAQSHLQRGYAQAAKEIRQYAQEWQNVFTYRTGYVAKEEADALQELLIYNDCYLLAETGYFSLLIEGKKFDVSESFQFLHTVEFSAIRGLRAINYSNNLANYERVIVALSCPVGVVGRYINHDAALIGGVAPGQFFAYMEFSGIVVQLSAASDYAEDTIAGNSLTLDSCYPVAISNPYGLPRHTIRKLNPGTTYNSDSEAAIGGIAIDGIYYVGTSHESGVPHKTAIIRKA